MSVFVKKGLEKGGPEKGNREQRAKNCFLTEVWMSALCVTGLVIAEFPEQMLGWCTYRLSLMSS